MGANNHVWERLPNNLAEAPEFLTLIQVAHIFGMSLENVRKLEAEAGNGFPERRQMSFAKVRKFRRDELIAWNEASRTETAS